MKVFILYFLLLLFAGILVFKSYVQDPDTEPIPLAFIDTLAFPLKEVPFKAPGRNWEACLYTFTHPVSLNITYTESGFSLYATGQLGIIEGMGRLSLSSGNQHFIYPVYLINEEKPNAKITDYRSPKTVNTDSSLTQQQILINTDTWLNVRPYPGSNQFFKEEKITLTTKAGIYRAQEDDPLSAYYVQPGSSTSIPLQYQYLQENNKFEVVAGPLRDAYDNIIADGTLVTFVYTDGEFIHQVEAVLIEGFAKVTFTMPASDSCRIYAQVIETKSATIELKPY